MTIGRRLTFAFGSVALIIAVGVGINSWQFVSMLHRTRALAATDDQVLAVYRVRADVGAIRRKLDSLSRSPDISKFGTAAHALRKEMLDDVERARGAFRETGTPIPGTLNALGETLADEFDAMHRLAGVSDWAAVRLRLDNQVDSILDNVREMVEQVDGDVSERRGLLVAQIELAQARAQMILALTAFVSLGAALALGLYVTRSIVNPVSQLKAAAHQFAEGDFDLALQPTSNDELGEVSEAFIVAARELHHYYSALKRSNEDLEQFAYAASHDLQEPLRTISTFSELLQRRYGDVLTGEAADCLTELLYASNQMRALVTGILEYSRLASSPNEAQEDINTEELVEEVRKNLKATIEQTSAVVRHDGLPNVRGSRPQLLQLFQNLVSNGIKYRRQGVPPDIHISGIRHADGWRFAVEDNGIGIDPRYYNQIFGMFKQLNRGTEGGVGMGLALSKRIVERHGGSISVTSSPGAGSRFSFTLKNPGADVPQSQMAISNSAV